MVQGNADRRKFLEISVSFNIDTFWEFMEKRQFKKFDLLISEKLSRPFFMSLEFYLSFEE